MEIYFQLLNPLIFAIFAVGFFCLNTARPDRAVRVVASSYIAGALAFLADIAFADAGVLARTFVAGLYALTAALLSCGLWLHYRREAPWRLTGALLVLHVGLYGVLLAADWLWMASFSANFGCGIFFAIGLLAFRSRVLAGIDRVVFIISAIGVAQCFIRPVGLAMLAGGTLTNANHDGELFVLTLHIFVAGSAVTTAMALLILFSTSLIVELQARAITDPLTGLLNRRGLGERAVRLLARYRQLPVCVIIADLDHFKRVNDRFGHDVGDAVLVRMAQIVRREDGEGRCVARLGGEEFALLTSGLTLEEATGVADRLRRQIGALSIETAGDAISCTASFGVAQLRRGETVASALARADAALYLSKAQGRDRVYTEVDFIIHQRQAANSALSEKGSDTGASHCA